LDPISGIHLKGSLRCLEIQYKQTQQRFTKSWPTTSRAAF